MDWSSLFDDAADGAAAAGDFGKGVFTGAKGGAVSMASGLKDLAVGAYNLVTEPDARSRATQAALSVAKYAGTLIEDPQSRSDAYDHAQQWVGTAVDRFTTARSQADKEGRLAEFYGTVAGRGGFEVGALLIPATKLGTAAKAAETAELAADTAKVARVGEALSEVKAAEVVSKCAGEAQVLDEATIARIQEMPKGQRPDPTTYMSADSIDTHLAQFDKGGTRFMTKSNLDKYGPAQRDGTAFLMPSSEADKLLASAGGNPRALEDALGLPEGFLDSDTLVRVDVTQPRDLKLRMPSGNEAGANNLWIPGGKLPTGTPEAVIDLGGASKSQYLATPLKLGEKK